MAPRSPTVQPGLSGLAQALLGGVKGYQGQVDRDRVEEERQLGRSIKMSTEADRQRASDTDFVMKGGMPTLGGALQANPQAMQAPQFVPNAPNDFDRTTKQFRQSAISPTDEVAVRGGMVNPMLPAQRQLEMAKMGRADIRGETAQALGMGGVQAPAGTEYFPNAAAQYFMPDEGNWQFVSENYGSPARWTNKKTLEVRQVPGSNPLPRPQTGLGTASISVGSQKVLENLNYYESAARNVIRLIDSRPESVGLQTVVGVKLSDRTDPHGVTVRAELATLSNQIRNGLFGAALSEKEAELAAQQLADGTNTEDSAKRRLGAILTYVNQKRKAVFDAANQAAAFERNGTVPQNDTDDAQSIEDELTAGFGPPPSKRKP